MLLKNLPEIREIEAIGSANSRLVRFQTLSKVRYKNQEIPIYGLVIGTEDKTKPTLALFGGVHGLERVGTHIIISYLKSLVEQSLRDKDTVNFFHQCRLISIPLINPIGMALDQRSNGNGVDLMRNAPVEAKDKTTWLLSGHRYTNKIPWYRGQEGSVELENQTVINFLREELFHSQSSISLDIHSGFGMKDRLWYPYAKTTESFPHIREALAIKNLLNRTRPYHIYRIEPQSDAYTTHGDLWDYLLDMHLAERDSDDSIYVPWTLEIGSWLWVRKNPRQLFSRTGLFNPIKEHRYNRTMRRHTILLDFLLNVVKNPGSWRI